MQQVEQRVAEARQHLAGATATTNQGGNSYNQAPVNIPITNPSATKNISTDVIRTESQIGNAAQPFTSTAKPEGSTDKAKTHQEEKA